MTHARTYVPITRERASHLLKPGRTQLLSAMAALAEFDAEVEHLFASDKLSEEGKYVVRLFDLPSQKWKEARGCP
jgi:hypothetical protein